MDRRKFLKIAGFSIAAATLSSCQAPQPRIDRASTPNIVVIFTDDQGYADVGCYGAKGFKTPNLDKMAAQGLKFTNFYAAQPICSASRAALLTGCYPNRIGIRGALNPRSQIGISDNEKTIADILKTKNYATAIFGKWHLGHHKQFLPLQHGFDEYLGIPYSNDMWPVGYDGKPADSKLRKSKYPPLPLIDGNQQVETLSTLADQDTLTTRYTERAVNFIRKNKDRPFFLYVPHSMPHVPLGVSDKFRGKSKQGMYGDVIMEIDWSVGQILKAIRKNGLDDNTLVIFTCDNGPWLSFGNHAGSALPLREGKGTTFDGGQRVPCIMRWPGNIKPGTTCNKIAATMDLLPTFAAITGAKLPDHKIDGVNILPLLKGVKNANPRDHFYYYYGDNQLQCVRKGKYKLHFPHGYRTVQGMAPGTDGFPGKYKYPKTSLELYDLEADISEQNNIADQRPDIVAQLQQLAEIAREDLGDMKRKGKGVRPPGKLE